ncbi:MAG: hypothetical protein WCG83_02395 [Candidatus Peregrinibacteria bacterium]
MPATLRERLHTADHILCTVAEQRFHVATRAMQVNAESCRIDFLTETDLRPFQESLEQKVNEIIRRNLAVTGMTLPRADAEKLISLASIPPDAQEVGIYEIAGFNRVPCAGPHVQNTQDIGIFSIAKIKKSGKNCWSVTYTVQ